MMSINKKISFLRYRLNRYLIGSFFKLSAMVTAVFFFVLLPIRYLLNLTGPLFFLLLTVTSIIYGYIVFKYCLCLFLRINSNEKTARWIEHRIPYFQGDLISALQLADNPAYLEKFGLSNKLAQLHIQRTQSLIDERSILNNPRFWPHPQPARYWVYIIGLMVMPLIFFSDFYADSIYSAYRDFFYPAPGAKQLLIVRPGCATVTAGSNLDVQAVVFTLQTVQPLIYYRVFNNGWEKRPMTMQSSQRYTYIFENIRKKLQYYVQLNTLKSEVYTIEPVTKPVILNHKITYTFPAYTGWEPETESRRQFDNIRALSNTTIQMDILTTAKLKSARIEVSEIQQVCTQIDGNSALFSFIINRDDKYTVHITDIYGQENEVIKTFNIESIDDKPPSVYLLYPEDTMEIPSDMEILIRYKASDDVALSKVELACSINQGKEKIIAITPADMNKKIEESYRWDLTKLRLSPGDELNYKIRVYDNFPPPGGPHISESSTLLLIFPSLAQMYKRRMEVFDDPGDKLARILDDHSEILRQLKKLDERSAGSDQISWTDRKSMTDLLNNQQKLNNAVQQESTNLKTELESLRVSADIIEDYMEIQKIMDSLLSADMKQRIAKLQETLKQSDAYSQIKNQLKMTQFDMQTYKDNLDRALSLLRKLSLKNKLRQLLEATNSAVTEQKRLNENLASQNRPDDLMNKQIAQMERLMKYLENTLRTAIKESGEYNNTDITDRLKDIQSFYDAQNLSKKVSSLKQNISKSTQQALSAGKNIQTGLAQLRDKLSDLLQSLASGKELTAEMVNIIDRLIRQSRNLHTLGESMKKYQGKNMQKNIELAKKLYFIEQELDRIGKAGKQLTKTTSMLDTQYYAPLFEVSASLAKENEKTFKKGDISVIAVIEEDIGKIQHTASLWVALLETLARTPQQSGQGGSPSDMDDFFSKLQNMADKQSDINKKTDTARSMGQGNPDISSYLQQLAMEQHILSQALSKLQQGVTADKRILGDLNNVARQMEKAARQIRENDLGTTLKERQQKILTRMLEAEKSIRTRDKSKKRIWEKPTHYDQASQPDKIDQKWLKSRLKRVSRRGLQSYVPTDYREMVDAYFQSLMELNK